MRDGLTGLSIRIQMDTDSPLLLGSGCLSLCGCSVHKKPWMDNTT